MEAGAVLFLQYFKAIAIAGEVGRVRFPAMLLICDIANHLLKLEVYEKVTDKQRRKNARPEVSTSGLSHFISVHKPKWEKL